MDLDKFEQLIKKNDLKGCYILYGPDENLIKDAVTKVENTVVDENFRELNLVKFDGMKVQFEEVMNACETLPFISDRKLVVVFRANFLGGKKIGKARRR